MNTRNTIIALVILIVAVCCRVYQPVFNFAPITAIALFSGYLFNNRIKSLAFVIFISLVSDSIVTSKQGIPLWHSTFLFVYGSYLLIALIGNYLHQNFSYKNLFISTLSSSLLFFIVTNFGVWLVDHLYTKDLQGFVACYVAAIPFYKISLLGDIMYAPLFFMGYQYLKSVGTKMQPSSVR